MQLISPPHYIRLNGGNHEISVSWLDWNNSENRIWDLVQNLKVAVPGLVFDFPHSTGKRNVKENFRIQILNNVRNMGRWNQKFWIPKVVTLSNSKLLISLHWCYGSKDRVDDQVLPAQYSDYEIRYLQINFPVELMQVVFSVLQNATKESIQINAIMSLYWIVHGIETSLNTYYIRM